MLPYTVDSVVYAAANSGSSSMARLKKAIDSISCPFRRSPMPSAYALRAGSDGVVACSTGTSNRLIEGNDSPSFVRMLEAIGPSTFRTSSLLDASFCSLATVAPLWQSVALSVST